jgi:plastocyanin
MASTLLLVLLRSAHGAEVPVTVLQLDGRPLADAIVIAEPEGPAGRVKAAAPSLSTHLVMDQRDLSFVPDVLVVRTGSSVEFPNSDKVRHQVYSFSGAKTFKLALYAGKAHPPVVFDKPGLVTLGCNIHDGMIGYLYVTDSPWFGRTDAQGRVVLAGVPEGTYTVRVWHPRSNDPATQLERPMQVTEPRVSAVTVQLARKLKPTRHNHGTDQRWDDY